jgi:hypothetical protein
MNVQREAALRALLPRIQFHGRLFAFVANQIRVWPRGIPAGITRLIV